MLLSDSIKNDEGKCVCGGKKVLLGGGHSFAFHSSSWFTHVSRFLLLSSSHSSHFRDCGW